jgi:hypothetical protein
MYISAQIERTEGDCMPVLQTARAAMAINPPIENPFPNAEVRVARLSIHNGAEIDESSYIRQGSQGADRWWNDFGVWVDERPWITHLICLNEPDTKTEAACKNADSFLYWWMILLDRRYGGRILGIIGNFSEGTPEPSVVVWFSRSHYYAYKHGHLWGFHSYWYPRLNADQERWNYSRWFYFYEAMKPYCPDHPNFMLTELGADGGTVGKIDHGWQTAGILDTDYLDDLADFKGYVERMGPLCTHGFIFAAITWDRFKTFSLSPSLLKCILDLNKSYSPEVPMDPIKETLPIDGRCMTVAEFDKYIKTLVFPSKRTSIYLHHTWRPTPETWAGKSTIEAMKRTYETYQWTDNNGRLHIGWTKGPHLFIAQDGIWLFYDITKDGWHAGGEYNVGSIGVEMVGNYDSSLPSGKILSNTLGALAVLHRHLGLNPDNLRFHRDVSQKTCPGTMVTKKWIIPQIKDEIAKQNPAQPPLIPVSYEWAYRWRMLSIPDHALYKYIKDKEYKFASPEFWNEAKPNDETAYQWAWDNNAAEYVLCAATPPSWGVTEVHRIK